MNILYRHFDANGVLLYIGASANISERNTSHANSSSWFGEVKTITLEHVPGKEALKEAERCAIKNETPLHNYQHTIYAKRRHPPKRKTVQPVKDIYYTDRKKVKELTLEKIEEIKNCTLQKRKTWHLFQLHDQTIQFIRGTEVEQKLEDMIFESRTSMYFEHQERQARYEMWEAGK